MKKLNEILLIDDSKATNSLTSRIILALEICHKITICDNGMQAFEYISNFTSDNTYPCPNLILLDINMPVLDGFQFLEKYRNLDVSMKKGSEIVMLTSSFNSVDKEKLSKIKEVNGFITKPLTEDNIKSTYKRIVESS